MSRFARIRNVKSRRKYSDVFDALKEEIVGGKYCAGSVFPSHAMIARRFGISNLTAVKVVEKLKNAGLVCSQQGRGTFVTRQGASRKIGILVPDIGQSELFSKIVHEIVQCAQNAGYLTLFGDTASPDAEFRAQKAEALARDFVAQGVAGVIFQPNEGVGDAESINRTVAAIFRNAGVALVLCDYDMVTPPARSEFDVVGSNNIEAGMRLAEHLVAAGAKRILFVLPPNAATSHVNRCRGAMALATSLRGECRCEAFEASPDDVTAFRKRFRRNRPDAIIGCNDKCAAELLRTLGKLKIRVPDDVMLAGFDDISIASLTIPSLTTIHQPCAKIARAAFGRLLARMRNPELDPMKITLDAPLVVRESTMRAKEKRTKK